MGRLESAGAPRSGGYFIAQLYRRDRSGPQLVLHRRNSNFREAWRLVPLHAPYGRFSISAGLDNVGLQSVAEDSTWPLFRQAETDRGAFHGLPALVGDLNNDAFCSPAAE